MGATTVPLIDVVTPAAHVGIAEHKGPEHVAVPPSRFESPQLFGTPPPPQIAGATHVPQLGVIPPHPSATCPQSAPALRHVAGVQVVEASPASGPEATAPQAFGTPPPPHVSGRVHVPH